MKTKQNAFISCTGLVNLLSYHNLALPVQISGVLVTCKLPNTVIYKVTRESFRNLFRK